MLVLLLAAAVAADPIVLQGTLDEVPSERFLFLPFTVPPGTAEIRVAHDDGSDANILDWGLLGPDGFRGWHGGNTSPAVVGEAAASPGYVPGPLAGEWEVIVGLAKIVELPITWDVDVELRDAATLPPETDRGPYVPPAPIVREAGWFAGDFHVHSVHSGDASPTLDAIATEASLRGLDFVEISEHDTISHLSLLSAVQARHPDVLLVPGIEWTTYGGHANAIGVTGYVPFHVGARGLTADDAAAEVAAQGGLFAPNHPVLDIGDLCIGCAWTHDVDVVHLSGLEIQTVSVDVIGHLMLEGALALWDELCDRGGHVAAIAGSDDHSGGTASGGFSSPIGTPTTYVHADELSVEALLQGIRDSRTFVKLGGPDDPFVTLDADGRDGDTVVAERATLRVRVEGARGGTLVLVQDGEDAASMPIDADPWEASWEVDAPAAAGDETRVRAHVLVGGVPRSITSHVWVRAPNPIDTEPPPRACEGCAATRRGAVGLPLLALFLLVRRRARRTR